MAEHAWSRANALAGYEERRFGRKVGHIHERLTGDSAGVEWVALYDGIVCGVYADAQQAREAVDGRAAELLHG